MSRTTYLDYNATAPPRPEVVSAVAEALSETGNPSSVHRLGRQARRRVEEAREAVARLVGATAAEVVFTSGGSEANALALLGVSQWGGGRPRVVVSAVEHDSVRKAVPEAEIMPVDPAGVIRLDRLEAILVGEGGPAIVSIMLANNETGVLQPVTEAAALAHRHGALVHCDAIQAAGKVPLDMRALGVDLMSLSAHKLGGPQGIGALIVREGVPLTARSVGGGQERGRRGGTENVPGIVGFGVAAEIALRDLPTMARVADLRDRLEAEARRIAPRVRVHGAEVPRLPNTTCLGLPGLSGEVQVMALDLAGVMVSAGSACSSGKVAASHVLAAMGLPPEEAGSAIRVSLGWRSGEDDVDHFLKAWAPLAARVAERAA